MHPLSSQVMDVVALYVAKAEFVYKRKLNMPRVEYNLRGRVGGLAYYRANKIRVNVDMLEDYTERYLAEVVPHEVAHLIAFQFFGFDIQDHGPEWKGVMVKLGRKPNRCHTLPVKLTRVHPKFRYICSCTKHTVGHIKHSRIQTRKLLVVCNDCRKILVFLNEIS